uniref:Uncharacterized protein n=1 Tax=Moniliophthora roreri TaxID=221103 RepID=A0A0W0GBR5_MONRR
MHAQKFWIH